MDKEAMQRRDTDPPREVDCSHRFVFGQRVPGRVGQIAAEGDLQARTKCQVVRVDSDQQTIGDGSNRISIAVNLIAVQEGLLGHGQCSQAHPGTLPRDRAVLTNMNWLSLSIVLSCRMFEANISPQWAAGRR